MNLAWHASYSRLILPTYVKFLNYFSRIGFVIRSKSTVDFVRLTFDYLNKIDPITSTAAALNFAVSLFRRIREKCRAQEQ